MQSFFFGNFEYHEGRRPAGMGKLPGILLGILITAVMICLPGCEKSSVIYLEQGNDGFTKDTLSDADTAADAQEDTGSGIKADTGPGVQVDTEADTHPETAIKEQADEETGKQLTAVTVFVCGAVKIPGVYELPAGSRAKAAVDAAGGFREDADTEWCNLAQPLFDGQKLRIYSLQETRNLESEGFAEDDADYSANTAGRLKSEGSGMNESAAYGTAAYILAGTGAQGIAGASSGSSSASEGGKINLNTATKEQLMTLPGIGDARAESILSWRRQHGAFTQIEQIKEISGLKNAIFNQIKDLITVG